MPASLFLRVFLLEKIIDFMLQDLLWTIFRSGKRFLYLSLSTGKGTEIRFVESKFLTVGLIGETINFQNRINQHKNDLKNNSSNSPLVEHREKYHHPIDISKSKLIIPNLSNKKERKLMESHIIMETQNFCRNDSLLAGDNILNKLIKPFKPFKNGVKRALAPN